MCHFLGDYVLQTDFLANTKKDNLYHLFIHCFLYCLPFYILFAIFEVDGGMILIYTAILFATHFLIDFLKIRKHINYVADQILHICIAIAVGEVYRILK